MAISSTLNRVNQNGNGVTVNVPIPFPFQSTTDLVVVETIIATGVQTTKTITTHYAVTGTPDVLGFYPNGGTVVAVAAFPSTVRWTVYRDAARTQTLDLTENNSFPAESTEAALDRQTMLIQRNADLTGRTMRQPDGDETTIAAMPSKVARASKFVAWDSNGDPIAAVGTSANLTPVSSFINTMLDDVDAAAARSTLGLPAITAKGSLIVGTAANTLGELVVGADGETPVVNALQATGVQWRSIYPPSIAPNPFFSVDQLVNSATSVADDAYGHDHWYALTQTGTIQVSTQTLQEDGLRTNARLTQNQAAAQRFGYACIIEASESQSYRNSILTFRPRVRISNSQTIRSAVLAWTGTADSVTSDIVNDWTSSDYTDGAAKFFVDTNITPLGNGIVTPSAATWTNGQALEASIPVNTNNIILLIWVQDVAAQNVTLDISRVSLVRGTYFGLIEIPTFSDTLMYAQRFFQKSFNYSIAPAQNTGSSAGAHFTGQPVGAATAFGAGSSRFSVQMLGNPAMATYNPSAVNVQMRNITTGADCSATGTVTGQNAVEFSATSAAGSAAGNRNLVHWTADTRL